MEDLEYISFDNRFGFNEEHFYIKKSEFHEEKLEKADSKTIYSRFLNLPENKKLFFLQYCIHYLKDNEVVNLLTFIKDIDLHYSNDFLFRNAVYKLKNKTIKWFIENDADVSCENNFAIQYLCDKGHSVESSLLKMLINHGADPKVSNDLPICLAARHQAVSWVKILIEEGADITVRNNLPICYLMNFSPRKEININFINFMIENGADITCRNNLPIVLAIESRIDLETLQYLVSMGADPLQHKSFILGEAFLHNQQLVPYLLNLGIDINEISEYDVVEIIQNMNVQSLQLLEEYGYDLSKINNFKKIDTISELKETFDFLTKNGVEPFVVASLLKIEQ